MINNTNDTKELIDGFYYNNKAINYVNKLNKKHFLNSYFDLTTIDILLMIDDSDYYKDIKKDLFINYDENYATVLYEAFTEIMEVAK